MFIENNTQYDDNGIPLGVKIMPDGSLAPRIDGITKVYPLCRYLVKQEFTKFDDSDPDNKRIAYKKKSFKIQWENIKNDLKRQFTFYPIPGQLAWKAGLPIAVDATTAGTVVGATSISLTHTCTGSNLVLVGIAFDPTGDGGTGMTYNDVSMTLAINTSAVAYQVIMKYLANPATGANTLAYTRADTRQLGLAAISFTGAKQTGQPDATAHFDGTAVTSPTNSLTTVADNSFVIDGIGSTTNAALGASQTEFYDVDSGTSERFGCQYVQKVTAGAQAMGWTWTGNESYDQNIMSVSPAAAVAVSNFLLMGV